METQLLCGYGEDVLPRATHSRRMLTSIRRLLSLERAHARLSTCAHCKTPAREEGAHRRARAFPSDAGRSQGPAFVSSDRCMRMRIRTMPLLGGAEDAAMTKNSFRVHCVDQLLDLSVWKFCVNDHQSILDV